MSKKTKHGKRLVVKESRRSKRSDVETKFGEILEKLRGRPDAYDAVAAVLKDIPVLNDKYDMRSVTTVALSAICSQLSGICSQVEAEHANNLKLLRDLFNTPTKVELEIMEELSKSTGKPINECSIIKMAKDLTPDQLARLSRVGITITPIVKKTVEEANEEKTH